MADDLKPCPFCNRRDVDGQMHKDGRVHCYRCGADGPTVPYARDDRFPTWNTRATDPRIEALERERDDLIHDLDRIKDSETEQLNRAEAAEAKLKVCEELGFAFEEDAGQLRTSLAAAREDALREAAALVDDELMRWGFPSSEGCRRDEMHTAILALIAKGAAE